MTQKRDCRRWEIISDYFGNDPNPYTTEEIFDYAKKCNEHHRLNPGDDPDWIPFDLYDRGDDIVDLNKTRGNEGFIVAIPYEDKL